MCGGHRTSLGEMDAQDKTCDNLFVKLWLSHGDTVRYKIAVLSEAILV